MQLIDPVEIYAYATRKVLVIEKEEIKCGNMIKQCTKWLDVRKENIKITWFKLAINFWSSIQNINNLKLWIWKKKFII